MTNEKENTDHIQTAEEWRDVVGYEGLYQVSNLGRVKSLDRVVNGKSHSQVIKRGKLLKIQYNIDGYCIVCLSKRSVYKHYKVHRLVAQAFIPNLDNLPCVNHKDEDKTNNRVDNLEWCTVLYNNGYGTKPSRISIAAKGRKPNEKLIQILRNRIRGEEERQKQKECKRAKMRPVFQFSFGGELLGEFESAKEAERCTGVHSGNILHCCTGWYKQSGGYVWKFK